MRAVIERAAAHHMLRAPRRRVYAYAAAAARASASDSAAARSIRRPALLMPLLLLRCYYCLPLLLRCRRCRLTLPLRYAAVTIITPPAMFLFAIDMPPPLSLSLRFRHTPMLPLFLHALRR